MVRSTSRFSPTVRLLLRRRAPTVPTLSVWWSHVSRKRCIIPKASLSLGAPCAILDELNFRQPGRMQFSSAIERPTMAQRLERDTYDAADCQAALRGEMLPSNLGNDVARQCVVSGIRRHIAFARSPEVTELAALPGQEVFARARNASLIMHDQVPPEDAMRKEAYPYCIWYPKVAKEETYRTLAQRYPDMRYQVGRACAVAGYTQLYRELDLLPDVSIAEEARESHASPGAKDILAEIMAAPLRYRVMDDYTRTIHLNNPVSPAFLNGDTAVLATLATRRRAYDSDIFLRKPWSESWDDFNITEDWNVDEEDEIPHCDPPELNAEELALFNSPLPLDLPTMNKTLLILYAAANGDVGRYARLRWKFPVESEDLCLVRGCYHSTAMATWLAKSPDVIESLKLDDEERARLWRAIHARRVMDGVISHLLDPSVVPDDELPYWIWYPKYPNRQDLLKLANARPTMRQQCLRASVAANYWEIFDEIMDSDPSLAPDCCTMKEIERSSNAHYREAVKQRKAHLDLDDLPFDSEWKLAMPYEDANPEHHMVGCKLRDTIWEIRFGEDQQIEYPYGFYEGYDLTLSKINLVLSMSEEERDKLGSMGCMC